MLKYGLIRERMSALLTDAIRANLLEEAGYQCRFWSFIDMEHTPKNILLRAVKSGKPKQTQALTKLMEELHISPTLAALMREERDTRMRKGIQKFLILLAVFIVALFGFSKLTNHETKDLTTDLVAPTLPVVYFEDNDHLVNELHGYVKEMSVISMRDTITPLLENGKLSLRIDPYDNKISKVTFQIRSLNGDRLVQDGEVQVSGDKSAMTGTISVENLLQEQTEYQLILQVTVGEQTSYYYTRIMEAGKSQIDDCVDFVEEFHAITMDKERQSELSSYMEPSSAADNTTLQKVTINNSLSQACWVILWEQK